MSFTLAPPQGVPDLSQAGAANGYATLDASSLVVQKPAGATTVATASMIPLADASGKILAAWGGSASTIATLDASSLVVQKPAGATTVGTAAMIPLADGAGKIAASWGGSASTLATLDASSLVVQKPAGATTTATASMIPLADANGRLATEWAPAVLRFIGAGANGERVDFDTLTEQLTLSTASVATDTSANLLPANALILGIVGRVTTGITTATQMKIGDAGVTDRFQSFGASVAVNATFVGLNPFMADRVTASMGPDQAAAAKIRVTFDTIPGAGVVRLTSFFAKFTAPTS